MPYYYAGWGGPTAWAFPSTKPCPVLLAAFAENNLFIPVIGLLINLRALDSSSSSLRGRNEGLTERFFSPGGFSLLGVSRLRSAELRYVLLQGPLDDQLDLFVELSFLLVFRHPGFGSGGNTAGVAKTRRKTVPFARFGPSRTL